VARLVKTGWGAHVPSGSLILQGRNNVVGACWIPENSDDAREIRSVWKTAALGMTPIRDEKSWQNVDDETVEVKLPQWKWQGLDKTLPGFSACFFYRLAIATFRLLQPWSGAPGGEFARHCQNIRGRNDGWRTSRGRRRGLFAIPGCGSHWP
jgi:hypothetical protein